MTEHWTGVKMQSSLSFKVKSPGEAVSTLKNYFARLTDEIDSKGVLRLASSTAYVIALSLSPLFIILIIASSMVSEAFQSELISKAAVIFGADVGKVMIDILNSAKQNSNYRGIAGLFSFIVVVVSASGIFAQMQVALNELGEFKVAKQPWTIIGFLKEKLALGGLVLGFAFFLITSMIFSTYVAYIQQTYAGSIANPIYQIFTFFVFSIAFALLYKFVPSHPIENKFALLAGVIASFLFFIGRMLLGVYFDYADVGSAYGAAGSFVLLLTWLYYSSLSLYVSFIMARLIRSPTHQR